MQNNTDWIATLGVGDTLCLVTMSAELKNRGKVLNKDYPMFTPFLYERVYGETDPSRPHSMRTLWLKAGGSAWSTGQCRVELLWPLPDLVVCNHIEMYAVYIIEGGVELYNRNPACWAVRDLYKLIRGHSRWSPVLPGELIDSRFTSVQRVREKPRTYAELMTECELEQDKKAARKQYMDTRQNTLRIKRYRKRNSPLLKRKKRGD